MSKYKVIQPFQWGCLEIEKGQTLTVLSQNEECPIVTSESHAGKSQIVSTKAVESMVFLKKIEVT